MAQTNTAPHEVIAAPYRLYVADVGTAKPAISAAESTFAGLGFSKVGSNGDLNYDRNTGVVLEMPRNITWWRSVGDLGPRKGFPVDEDIIVKVRLVDLTLEQLAYVLNGNTVDASAGGSRKIGLSRGYTIATYALLVRSDVSPYGDQLSSQFWIPRAALTGSPTVNLAKPGEPAAFDIEFKALTDPTAADPSEYLGLYEAEDDTT